ncbi:MAG: shikimate dehydrogenase, partial [Bacteroidales bacterium]
ETAPAIPYEYLTEKHLLFDLVYNPEVTRFLQYGKDAGATSINGLEMLYLQAEAAWIFWNK